MGHKFQKVPCSKCGTLIGKNQLSRHENKCDGGAAGAASASTH